VDIGDYIITYKLSLFIPLNKLVPNFHIPLVDVLSRGLLEDLLRDVNPLGDCLSGLRVVVWLVEFFLHYTR
jgi:hypothetical protein